MGELLARAMQGVDPGAPGAFWKIVANLMAMVPWTTLFWWNLAFVAVGAVLGWWRGRFWAGVLWAWILGPVGWCVFLVRTRTRAVPPPLPRQR